MASLERQPSINSGEKEKEEVLNPHHFYVAYIYDQPQLYEQDITTFIEQAQAMDYSLRYWWLSEAIQIEGFEDAPDRLILCVTTRARNEDAGLDLYETLEGEEIFWDELEAASYFEYDRLGKRLMEVEDIRTPSGETLFEPSPIPLLQLDREELQEVAYHLLGRQLKRHEIRAVSEALKQHINAQIDWESTLRDSLVTSQELGLLDDVTRQGK